jgi:hypothetical protein
MIFYKWLRSKFGFKMVVPILFQNSELYHIFYKYVDSNEIEKGSVGKMENMVELGDFKPDSKQQQQMIRILFEEMS